jgi:hypothetical protein
LAVGLVGCAPTDAVEGESSSALSTLDTTHTGVGALVFRQLSGNLWNLCSGALISPTVFLTAGHCTEAMKEYEASYGKTPYVTFDQQVLPSSPVISGTVVTAPDYKPVVYNLNNDSHDVGIVLLDQPVTDRPIYPLALRNSVTPPQVKPGTTITAVGYGVDQNSSSGKPGSTTQPNDKTRDSGALSFVAGSTAWISANQVHADGVCFGDSGGPSFITIDGQERIAGVNSIINGYDCAEMTWSYRVDSDASRAFLGHYVTLP